jgi:triphosphoribosyl-dephospho-CoA synthase
LSDGLEIYIIRLQNSGDKMQPQSSTFVVGQTTAIHRGLTAERRQRLYPDPAHLARHASQALIEEAELTPKPGLVDQRGSGSHHDLSLELLVTSAHVLERYFQLMAEEAQRERVSTVLRTTLGKLGREAESEMLKATKGTNTHRGAIWSLGLLTAGAAMQLSPDASLICLDAGRLARLPDPFACIRRPQKAQPWRTSSDFGARSEAFNGFRHVLSIALPALRRARAIGVSESLARVDALLAIMAMLHDTCILRRGGTSALLAVQSGAKRVGELGGSSTPAGSTALKILEQIMLRLWVSPGGSADLLGAALFLDRLTADRIASCD